jgi:hypothetical protein
MGAQLATRPFGWIVSGRTPTGALNVARTVPFAA